MLVGGWKVEEIRVLLRLSHLAALAEAAQQQSRVGGHDAVLHVFAGVLQRCSAHT